jgi:hypothetical protein
LHERTQAQSTSEEKLESEDGVDIDELIKKFRNTKRSKKN